MGDRLKQCFRSNRKMKFKNLKELLDIGKIPNNKRYLSDCIFNKFYGNDTQFVKNKIDLVYEKIFKTQD